MSLAIRAAFLFERRPGWAGRAVLWGAAACLVLPLSLLAVIVGVAGIPAGSAGSDPAPATATAPMDSWTLTQPFGCTGVSLEPPAPGCSHFHAGIDLAAPAGTAVRAVLAGTATVIDQPTGYGLHVVVAVGNRMSILYGHLGFAAVVTGQPVSGGGLIGYEGSTGASTGPHLHLEVREDGHPVDPRQVFPDLFGIGATHPHRASLGTVPGEPSHLGEPPWSTASSSSAA